MHSGVHADRSSWRIPPDETLQVADPKAKKAEVGDEEVSTRRKVPLHPSKFFPGYGKQV